MPKSFRIISVCIIFLFMIACGSAPQVTEQPTADNLPATQVPNVNPTESVPAVNTNQPSAEPSGLKVAYLLNANVWFWSETTPAKQLTNEGNAGLMKLSDDGRVIAYTRGQGLWAINSDGTNPRELVADLAAFTGRPVITQIEFQPGTHIVYFSMRESVQSSVGVDLHRVDADSPAQQTLLQQGGQFTFSQDGRLLALADVNRINILRVDGPTLVSALDFVQVNTYSDWSYYPQVVWLSDSSGFYTVIPASDPVAKPGQKARFLYVAADGSFTAQLAEFVTADIRISQPLIAPNGSKVAYASQNEKTLELHVIDASTADVIVASHPDALDLRPWAWSPDSTRVAYWTGNLPMMAGINIASALVADSLTGHSLAWVDANRFLYITTDGELRLGTLGNPNLTLIASGFALGQDARFYDFAP